MRLKIILIMIFLPNLVWAEWTTLAPMPTPRYGAAIAAVGNDIYVMGGTQMQPMGLLDIVESYDTINDVWQTDLPELHHARRFTCAAVYENSIFVSYKGVKSSYIIFFLENSNHLIEI